MTAYLAENGIASSWVPDLCLAAETQVYPRRERIVCTDSVVRPFNPLLERYSTGLQATFAPMRPGRCRSYWRYVLVIAGDGIGSDVQAIAARAGSIDFVYRIESMRLQDRNRFRLRNGEKT